ncbi:hypothetical protein TPAR_07543, partial [Tolypocladium paradoxum]
MSAASARSTSTGRVQRANTPATTAVCPSSGLTKPTRRLLRRRSDTPASRLLPWTRLHEPSASATPCVLVSLRLPAIPRSGATCMAVSSRTTGSSRIVTWAPARRGSRISPISLAAASRSNGAAARPKLQVAARDAGTSEARLRDPMHGAQGRGTTVEYGGGIFIEAFHHAVMPCYIFITCYILSRPARLGACALLPFPTKDFPSFLRIRHIDPVLAQHHDLLEEPPPLERVPLDLDEPDVEDLGAVGKGLLVDLDLAVQALMPPVESLDLDVGDWVAVQAGRDGAQGHVELVQGVAKHLHDVGGRHVGEEAGERLGRTNVAEPTGLLRQGHGGTWGVGELRHGRLVGEGIEEHAARIGGARGQGGGWYGHGAEDGLLPVPVRV